MGKNPTKAEIDAARAALQAGDAAIVDELMTRVDGALSFAESAAPDTAKAARRIDTAVQFLRALKKKDAEL